MKKGVLSWKSCGLRFAIVSLLAFATVFGLSPTAFSQTETGQISGTVKDPTGALVAGAKIIIKSVNTGMMRETETNSVGVYTVPSLRPDTYDVTVQAQGFKKNVRRIEVIVGSNNEVSPVLEVGESAVTVEVAGTTEGVEVNTETSTLSQTVSSKQMMELPTLTRNPYDLVGTAGNV